MRSRLGLIVSLCAVMFATPVWAHRIDEYLQATIFSLEAGQAHGAMRLIPGMLVSSSVIESIDRNGDGRFSEEEERSYAQSVLKDLTITVDRKPASPTLNAWSFPTLEQMHAGLGEIHIDYSIPLPVSGANRSLVVANHHQSGKSVYLMNVLVPERPALRIVAQKRNEQQSLFEVDFQQSDEVGGSWLKDVQLSLSGLPVGNLFRLGLRHIAEGTDHLLFLLVLLLPAPLLMAGNHWSLPAPPRRSLWRILAVVTAFTIGHSLTLSAAALGFVRVPEPPIEVLIAVSILISAIHALRPVFPGKEALIAGFFGLIHGLAFAATLDRLGLGRWERVVGILSFNLGIETMQMVVVAAILPSLMLMSRTPAYAILRVAGASFAGLAAMGWIVERLFNAELGVDRWVNVFADHAVLLAAGLFVASLAGWSLLSSGSPLRRRGFGAATPQAEGAVR